MTRRAMGAANPYFRNAYRLQQEYQQPFQSDIQSYMNPYSQNVLSKIRKESMDALRENILPELESRFVRAGQFGSSRHKDLASKFSKEALADMETRQQEALSRHYQEAAQIQNADRARKLAASRESGLLGEAEQLSRLKDAAALNEQGRYMQNRAQMGSDVEYQDYLRRMMRPYEQIQGLAAILHGLPTNRQWSSLDYIPLSPQLNTAGQLGSLAGQVYGMRQAMGGGR
jgi:hypothetical protein